MCECACGDCVDFKRELLWAVPLRNIRLCCVGQVLPPVGYNEMPRDLSPDNW
jgi:hypothetical protein